MSDVGMISFYFYSSSYFQNQGWDLSKSKKEVKKRMSDIKGPTNPEYFRSFVIDAGSAAPRVVGAV